MKRLMAPRLRAGTWAKSLPIRLLEQQREEECGGEGESDGEAMIILGKSYISGKKDG